jgi:lipopolysaccharide export system protein LptC
MVLPGIILARSPFFVRMKRQYHIYVALSLAVAISACMDTVVNFEPIRDKRGYALEIAEDVHIRYSDSSMLRVVVSGPQLKRYIYKFRVEEEFPKGVHVEFYDEMGSPTAWLDAKYAIRKPNEKKITARDSVVLFNIEGGRIETTELIWNERDHSLSTERFVKIIRPTGDTLTSYGLKTNETFTEYELFSVEGDMSVKDSEKKN